ncbi:MAG: hypothetical protein GY928_34095 [Colwellia sp.]|nr:hypothetical protein [Colwellia sp.]
MPYKGDPYNTRIRGDINEVRLISVDEAEEDMEPGLAVYSSSADKVSKSISTSLATAVSLGLSLTTGNPADGSVQDIRVGRSVSVVTFGPVSGFDGLTPNEIYYPSDLVAGELMDFSELTAGSSLSSLGFALSPTEIMVRPVQTREVKA